jgi:hypothetical protein
MGEHGASRNLSGEWRSWYRYYSSSRQEEFEDEHRVMLYQKGRRLSGTSIPDQSGSKLTLKLEIDGRDINGTWQERTSPAGYYQGRLLRGALTLILAQDASHMEGLWTGVDSDYRFVNYGKWIFEKIQTGTT